ncbi:MAG: SDR family oxidoreductase [Pseudomonadota bacterium]|nr:SDR family oxidoreductase [Pseudomonadota bacterium]MEC8155072.1 SDR family oxidoreductase [Pseudomonadota bacterium]MEC8274606.1 SDR family oxidoreductase [Pseudomonadota bacterium]
MADTPRSCLIVGAGDATGAAVARAFAREGLVACPVRRARNADKLEMLAQSIRDEGLQARAFPADARDEDSVIALVEQVEAKVGPIEVAVFNIGGNVSFPITEMTARVYHKVWEMAAFAGFLVGREVARRMVTRERGTIIFTGATASTRGRPGMAAFAGAKHALRALAQSMARELGPKNIHVAHAIIDGAIDTAFSRERIPDAEARVAEDLILDPAHIAEAYVMLHRQPRTAWTHEIDLRPWGEPW